MQRNSDGHKNLSNTSTSCSYTATNNATYQQEHMQKDQNMLNPANIKIKTVESRKNRKEISHLVLQKHLVVTQQQTMPHSNKKL